MGKRYDIAVIGAGIIGSACAMELARRGRSVLILESVDVASDTSCRAMGHVGAYDDSETQLTLTRFARGLWEELAPELPPEVDYVRRGALWVASTEEELAEVERKVTTYTRAGVEAHAVDSRPLSEMEPNLRRGLPGALFVPGDVVLDAAEATRFLARRAESLGAELRIRSPVRAVRDDGVQLDDGSQVAADRVVVAAGWQIPKLIPGFPVRPRKGHIALTVPHPGYVHHQVSEVGYVRGAEPGREESITFSFQPRTNGRYLIGATRQYAGSSTLVEPRIIEQLLARARYFLPDIDRIGIERTWAGLRPAGPDAVPVIGPLPGRPNVILAAAHEGIGITTCLATATLVADVIDGRPPPIPLFPYRAERLVFPHDGAPGAARR